MILNENEVLVIKELTRCAFITAMFYIAASALKSIVSDLNKDCDSDFTEALDKVAYRLKSIEEKIDALLDAMGNTIDKSNLNGFQNIINGMLKPAGFYSINFKTDASKASDTDAESE